MGGLVVKKVSSFEVSPPRRPCTGAAPSLGDGVADMNQAYLLAKQGVTYPGVADRIHTLYFLGTPHGGSELSRTLKSLLTVSSLGSKAFVNELIPGSSTLQVTYS